MLKHLLGSMFKTGSLTMLLPGGKSETYGSGEPHVVVRLHDRRAVAELLLDSDLNLGELYMDGRFTVENGDIDDFLELVLANIGDEQATGVRHLSRLFRSVTRGVRQFNQARRAKRNVAHHYDLSAKLYDTFLDADRQYSCAYFARGDETLDEAQAAKKRHIAAKLQLARPGLRILDIGCGWGGLALDLARDAGAQVLGITLSEEQIAMARQRSEQARLTDRCRFELADYRALSGVYDRIVSVGMFEHVGVPQYPGQPAGRLVAAGRFPDRPGGQSPRGQPGGPEPGGRQPRGDRPDGRQPRQHQPVEGEPDRVRPDRCQSQGCQPVPRDADRYHVVGDHLPEREELDGSERWVRAAARLPVWRSHHAGAGQQDP
jgi:SAM-dependent methyltransferase